MKTTYMHTFLLAAAVAAAILPAQAAPPIVKTLPTIIIGDMSADNYDSVSGKGILRYTHALDLKSPAVVDWNNDGASSDTFHAYLYPFDASPATNIKPFNETRVIGTLTTAEYMNLMANGAPPAADARITSYTASYQNFWLNLFDSSRHPDITNPYSASPATLGKVPDPAYMRDVSMRLVCAVSSGTKLIAGDSVLKVKCQSGGVNSTVQTFQPVAEYSFTGSNCGWTFSTYGCGFTDPTPTTIGPGTTGIGFAVSSPIVLLDPNRCMYGLWRSPTNIPSDGSMQGKVYRATARLESTSASADLCPGYRFRYHNKGFSHQGFMIVETKHTPPAGDILNLPWAGHPFTAKVFWAPRPDLGDMGDSEGQAQVPGDYRKYSLAWEIIGWTGEVGTLTMESVVVESFPRPPTGPRKIAWGTDPGMIPFDAPSSSLGWVSRDDLQDFYHTNGSIETSSSYVKLRLTGAEKTARYCGVKPHFTALTKNLKAEQNHLYRFSVKLACGSPTAVPTYRVGVNSQILQPGQTFGKFRAVGWLEWFSFCSVVGAGGKQGSFLLPGQTVCPFAPATTGSLIDVYVYSHSIPPASAGSVYFIPILSIVDSGYYGTGTRWPDPNTAMEWSAASWEDLGPDY